MILKRELFRDTKNGKIAGVCAGLAAYLGWEIWLVRVLVVSATLFGMQFLILFYIAGWFILDKKNEESKPFISTSNNTGNEKTSAEEQSESIKVKAKVWQSGEPPKQALQDITKKFSLLENQLRTIEHYITSPEFSLSREINKL